MKLLNLYGVKTNTLAIIGNGFDIAHGYKTDYRSFVDNTKDEALDTFKEICKNEKAIEKWYNFEENIAIIMTNFYSDAVRGRYGYENIDAERLKIHKMFERIKMLLFAYLRNETKRKKPEYIDSIKQYIEENTQIINFNYTNIAHIYSKHIYYVHGSLEENDILLGYDYKEEPCLSGYLDMYWAKSLCRERLTFNRMLRKKILSEKRKQILTDSFETYQEMRNSGRGIDEESKKELTNFRFINRIFKHLVNKLPPIRYKTIRTLVVLGHGIEADQVYLNEILEKCSRINQIVLFTYREEAVDSLNKKKEFLCKYCDNIVTEYYI